MAVVLGQQQQKTLAQQQDQQANSNQCQAGYWHLRQ